MSKDPREAFTFLGIFPGEPEKAPVDPAKAAEAIKQLAETFVDGGGSLTPTEPTKRRPRSENSGSWTPVL